MEGLDVILNAISTVGFPIAMCIYLIYSGKKRDEKYTSCIEDLRKTIENNTLVIQKFIDRTDRMGKDDD